MKEIKWNNDTWYYLVKVDSSEYGEYWYTEFYRTPTKLRKKYYLFGDLVEVENDDYEFKVGFNIEDEYLSKEQLREKLAPEFNKEKRKLEIEKGEII